MQTTARRSSRTFPLVLFLVPEEITSYIGTTKESLTTLTTKWMRQIRLIALIRVGYAFYRTRIINRTRKISKFRHLTQQVFTTGKNCSGLIKKVFWGIHRLTPIITLEVINIFRPLRLPTRSNTLRGMYRVLARVTYSFISITNIEMGTTTKLTRIKRIYIHLENIAERQINQIIGRERLRSALITTRVVRINSLRIIALI